LRDTRSFFHTNWTRDQMHRIQRHRFSKFIRLKRKLSSTHPMYQSSMPLVNLTSRSLLKSCPPLCFNTVKYIMHEWYSAHINCALSQGVKCDQKSHQRLKYYPEQPGVSFQFSRIFGVHLEPVLRDTRTFLQANWTRTDQIGPTCHFQTLPST
jgi:ferredoxin-like protein FixX